MLKNPIPEGIPSTPGKLISANSTNATKVTGEPTAIDFLTASNTNASPRYLKLYNTRATVVVGTTIPTNTFLIPGNSGSGTNLPVPPKGLQYDEGFAFAITASAADNDTTVVAASEVIVNYQFRSTNQG